ncbi:MAG TPA: DNA polymerase III subunit epsilon [Alphaproteobacteria bacterium]|nr:DNA polymerase III subunit epsilon [Alphaproteobacteria bacterium]
MREIVLDTETTGLDQRNDRIIEIGCIELFNHVPTGVTFHTYLNPRRDIAAEAFNVHGISAEFLSDKPQFGDIAEAFSEFIADTQLVIHNAAFDLGFLNSEFDRIGFGKLPPGRAIDTLLIARRKFPGAQNSLDGLCRRFNIDISDRELHGALKDSQLLAAVYLELIGGAQSGLAFDDPAGAKQAVTADGSPAAVLRPGRPAPLAPLLKEAELMAHEAFIATLGGNPLWKR